jgi:hypothetical protein
LTGRVSFKSASDRPLSGIEVAFGPKISYFAKSAGDGSIVFPAMYVGRYQLGYVRGISDSSYVSSVMQDSHDVFREGIVVDDHSAAVEVVIADDAGVVFGKVADASGHGVQNALVALVPEAALKERKDYYGAYRETRTDQNGDFEMRGITPGTYHAYAWADIPASAFRNAEFMNAFAGKGTPVTVESGSKLQLTLTEIR